MPAAGQARWCSKLLEGGPFSRLCASSGSTIGDSAAARCSVCPPSLLCWTLQAAALVLCAKATVHKKIAQNHSSAAQQQQETVQVDTEALYTNSGFLPARAFGPLKLTSVPGELAHALGSGMCVLACTPDSLTRASGGVHPRARAPACVRAGSGRGLVLTAPVAPGALLLVSEPAGQVVRAAEGQALTPTHLLGAWQRADHGALSPEDRRRLALLFHGGDKRPPSTTLAAFLGPAGGDGAKAAAKAKGGAPKKGFGAAPAPTAEPPAGEGNRSCTVRGHMRSGLGTPRKCQPGPAGSDPGCTRPQRQPILPSRVAGWLQSWTTARSPTSSGSTPGER